MFTGNSSVTFTTSREKAEVYKEIEDLLEALGTVHISSSGGITISGSRFQGFSYKPNIDGRVSEREGRYTVNLDFQAKPDTMGWLIAICAFPIGLAIFILPNKAKAEIQRKSDHALSEVKSTFK